MEQEKPVKIQISGKLSYADDITLNQAAQIIAFIDSSSSMGTVIPAADTRLAPVSIASGGGRSANAREILDSSGAKTNPEKIVAFASLVLDDGKDTFTLEDVKPLFRRAREATPKNITRDLDAAVRAGWVTDADEKGEYYLTKKALEVVESGFNSTRGTRTAAVPTARRARTNTSSKPRRTSNEVPEVFKSIDPIPHNIEGIIGYTKLKQDQDRFLWVLKLAKTLKIDGLTNAEIVWVTDHLGAGIASKQITSKFDRARQSGRVNRSTQTQRIRIAPDGEDYLASLGEKA